jgi:hypothetical protein
MGAPRRDDRQRESAMSYVFAFWLALAALFPGSQSLSYRNLTGQEESRAFFRNAAHGYDGKLVHVHVSAKRIHGDPARIARTSKGARVFVFENQSVPLVIHPTSTYYRKILERTAPSERVCVKGEIRAEPVGGKDRLALWVHSVKRAHDEKNVKKSGSKAKPATGKW